MVDAGTLLQQCRRKLTGMTARLTNGESTTTSEGGSVWHDLCVDETDPPELGVCADSKEQEETFRSGHGDLLRVPDTDRETELSDTSTDSACSGLQRSSSGSLLKLWKPSTHLPDALAFMQRFGRSSSALPEPAVELGMSDSGDRGRVHILSAMDVGLSNKIDRLR